MQTWTDLTRLRTYPLHEEGPPVYNRWASPLGVPVLLNKSGRRLLLERWVERFKHMLHNSSLNHRYAIRKAF